MRNALTASERRGILVVAGVALIITTCGWGVSRCDRPESEGSASEVEVLVRGDSTTKADSTKVKEKRRRKSNNDSVRKKRTKTPKLYRRRSPLDEPL